MEGFGLPILESLWHGKPCVCGGNGALGEVAQGGGCLIVDQTSEHAIAAGIKKLLRDQATYGRLCVAARARKFRLWSDYIEKLLEHLQLLFSISACIDPALHRARKNKPSSSITDSLQVSLTPEEVNRSS